MSRPNPAWMHDADAMKRLCDRLFSDPSKWVHGSLAIDPGAPADGMPAAEAAGKGFDVAEIAGGIVAIHPDGTMMCSVLGRDPNVLYRIVPVAGDAK